MSDQARSTHYATASPTSETPAPSSSDTPSSSEVLTPEHPGPWLKTPSDADSTPWAQAGRIAALDQITRHDLDAGWRPDEGDDQ